MFVCCFWRLIRGFSRCRKSSFREALQAHVKRLFTVSGSARRGLTVVFSQSLQQVAQTDSKVVKEKVVRSLELGQFLVKHVQQQVGGPARS